MNFIWNPLLDGETRCVLESRNALVELRVIIGGNGLFTPLILGMADKKFRLSPKGAETRVLFSKMLLQTGTRREAQANAESEAVRLIAKTLAKPAPAAASP